MTRTAVLALGGNALARAGERATIANQFRHARESVAPIIELARDGWRIAIVHGNGPQVGDELVRHELSQGEVEPLPLGVLVAGTAGWIGYMLQQSLENGLAEAGVARPVATIITQTEVDPADPGFGNATKPIGHEMPQSRADALRANGVSVGKDGAGHWRRLAASPRPLSVRLRLPAPVEVTDRVLSSCPRSAGVNATRTLHDWPLASSVTPDEHSPAAGTACVNSGRLNESDSAPEGAAPGLLMVNVRSTTAPSCAPPKS